MFFFLSKVLNFFISPMIWVFTFLLWSLFSKSQHQKKAHVKKAFWILFIFSNFFLLNEAERLWEIKPKKAESLYKQYDVAIVLGGLCYYDEEYDKIIFRDANDRLMQAIELYKTGKVKKILFSGGSAYIMDDKQKEAEFVAKYLINIGIPKEDVLIESLSRNTRENALYTKELLLKNNVDGPLLLITSGFHLRRAKGCFKKVGLNVDTYATDRTALQRSYSFDSLFIPSSDALSTWSQLIHEIVGYGVYKVMRYV